MAVYYAQNNGGGGLGSGLGIVGSLLSFVPGMQGVGAGVSALGSALNGNYAGVAKSAAAAATGAKTPQATAMQTSTAINNALKPSSAEELQRMFQDYNLGR